MGTMTEAKGSEFLRDKPGAAWEDFQLRTVVLSSALMLARMDASAVLSSLFFGLCTLCLDLDVDL